MTGWSARARAAPICPLTTIGAAGAVASRWWTAAGRARAAKLASPVVTVTAVRMASSRLAGSSGADRVRRSTNITRDPRAALLPPGRVAVSRTSVPKLRPMNPTLRPRSRAARSRAPSVIRLARNRCEFQAASLRPGQVPAAGSSRGGWSSGRRRAVLRRTGGRRGSRACGGCRSPSAGTHSAAAAGRRPCSARSGPAAAGTAAGWPLATAIVAAIRILIASPSGIWKDRPGIKAGKKYPATLRKPG